MGEGIFDQLGITEEVVAQIEPEKVSESRIIDSGVYKATVEKAYVRKTDKGAKMLEIDFILDVDGNNVQYHYSNAIQSGDEKGNKPFYINKNGKQVPLPGIVAMKKFFDAVGISNPQGIDGEVNHFGTKIRVKALTGIQGKKLVLGIIQEKSIYNNNVMTKNNVRYFLDADGKVGDTYYLDKAIENIKGYPLVDKTKGQAPAPAQPATAGSEEIVKSGW